MDFFLQNYILTIKRAHGENLDTDVQVYTIFDSKYHGCLYMHCSLCALISLDLVYAHDFCFSLVLYRRFLDLFICFSVCIMASCLTKI